MVFFQTVLFLGYAYAHFSQRMFRPAVQAAVHLLLYWPQHCRIADRPRRFLEACARSIADVAHFDAADGLRGSAVFRALDHGAVGASVVQPHVS